MTSTIESSHMNLVYSSFQLHRFLINSSPNPGTQLQPINVDNMVRVMPYPPFGSDIDPYISEVPYALKNISWSIEDTGQNTSSQISDAILCFLEIYALNPDQPVDKSYWKKYFQLNKRSTVAPNGVLFQIPDDSGKICINLQEDGEDLLFGYGIVFTVDVEKEEKIVTYFCRKDPIANIRSRRTT